MREELLEIIKDEDRVITENIDPQYLSDNLGRKHGTASALVFAKSTEEVSGILEVNLTIPVYRNLSNFNNKRYIEQLSEDSCFSLFCKNLNIVDLRNSQTELKYDLS